MSSIKLTLELACTSEEAARFAAVELFLAEVARTPRPSPRPNSTPSSALGHARRSLALPGTRSRSGLPSDMARTEA
jgi:hypothetical protein